MKPTLRRKNFSSFDLKSAFQQLGITKLIPWDPQAGSVTPSDFFHQHLIRLQRFDLRSSEKSKELLIDAILQEAIQAFGRLKIWKGVYIESDQVCGTPDYLLAEDKDYLEAPLLCVIEAKRDDFEQGLAQCLPAMQACQGCNQEMGTNITVFGIVTNGNGWQFYQLSSSGDVYETVLFSLSDVAAILGVLRLIFQQCEHTLYQPISSENARS